MASVFVLLEAFNRKEAAALGFFPCATASFICYAVFDICQELQPYSGGTSGYAIIATGESAIYANVLLKKGVVQ